MDFFIAFFFISIWTNEGQVFNDSDSVCPLGGAVDQAVGPDEGRRVASYHVAVNFDYHPNALQVCKNPGV